VSKREKITFFSALPPFRGGIAQFSEQFRQSLAKKRDVDAFTFQNQYPNYFHHVFLCDFLNTQFHPQPNKKKTTKQRKQVTNHQLPM
jgi:hypothetical protein